MLNDGAMQVIGGEGGLRPKMNQKKRQQKLQGIDYVIN